MSTAKTAAANVLLPPGRFDHVHKGHVVQFYTDDAALIEALSRFIGAALGSGDTALAIATKAHRDSLGERLEAHGINLSEAVQSGRYVALDASETLSKLLVDGYPDANLFERVIGSTISRLRAKAKDEDLPVAAFGEMVALLWAERKTQAAIRLEELWNKLALKHPLALRCGYPMNGFNRQRDGEMYLKVSAQHSAVIPSRDGAARAEDEAGHPDDADPHGDELQAFEAEAALRQSEERFRLFVEGVQDYALFMLDTDGRVDSWNVGAERIKGYKASEIIGKHFSCFYPEDEIAAGKPQKDLDIAASRGRFEDEGWRIRKDGTRFWASLIITAVKDGSGRLRGFGKVTRDITERIAAERKLHESEQSLRRLSGHLLRTQDEERRRLGRELHDSVGQYLAALKMGLDSLGDDTGEGAECLRLVDQCIAEVRTISYLLYPPMLEELGLRSAIPWYLEGFSKRSGIETALDMTSDFGRLSRDTELALFRVLQESLTNVHRHSGSKKADVHLRVKDDTVHLEISDYGKGIPASMLTSSRGDVGTMGVGLRGMTERMRQLGGDVELISSEEGTTVRAAIPARRETAEAD